MPTRHKNVRALLKSGQEASEPQAYFYTCMRSVLASARLLFWSGQCLELPFILKRLGNWGRGKRPAAAGRHSCRAAYTDPRLCSRMHIELNHVHVSAPSWTTKPWNGAGLTSPCVILSLVKLVKNCRNRIYVNLTSALCFFNLLKDKQIKWGIRETVHGSKIQTGVMVWSMRGDTTL